MEMDNDNRKEREATDMSLQPGNANLTTGETGAPLDSWDAAMARQRNLDEQAAITQNQQMFDQYGSIESADRQRQYALDSQRSIAGAAMMQSAFRNGGLSDRSLSDAFSTAFGQPVRGGQFVDFGDKRGQGFVIYGDRKTPDGRTFITPVAMMNGVQMIKVLQKAKLGDRTLDLQKRIYGNLASRFTADQLEKAGVHNPTAPISTGSTTISGAAMRALRGEPRQRGSVSMFSNVGGDGKIGTGSISRTMHPDGTIEETTTGTRSPDWEGKWKSISSDSEGKVYVNDKTGEEVRVPKGHTLRGVLQGSAEKERMLQQQTEAKNAQLREQREYETQTRKEQREYEDKKHQKELRAKVLGEAAKGVVKAMQDNPNISQEQIAGLLDELVKRLDGSSAKGGGNENPLEGETGGANANGAGAGAQTAEQGGEVTAPSAEETANANEQIERIRAEQEKRKNASQDPKNTRRVNAFLRMG